MNRTRLVALAVTPAFLAVSVAAAPVAQAGNPHNKPAASASYAKGDHRDHGGRHGSAVCDLGATPAIFKIAQETKKNRNFRAAAWTNDDLQLTLMSIPVGGDVGLEMHSDIDQFLRVESGTAEVMMGSETSLDYVKNANAGDVILIPSGT